MSDTGSDTGIRKLSVRIKLVDGAKKLAQKGQFDEALKILRRVREAYSDEKMQKKVDWLIDEIEAQKTQD
jgi:hypothetical protein